MSRERSSTINSLKNEVDDIFDIVFSQHFEKPGNKGMNKQDYANGILFHFNDDVYSLEGCWLRCGLRGFG